MMIQRSVFGLGVVVLAACGADKSEDSAAAGTVSVFPDGTSVWTGTAELSGATLPTTAELVRDGELLEASITAEIGGQSLTYTAQGRVELATGRVSLAPGSWEGEDPGLEVVGVVATYDPATGELTGELRDTQTWESPEEGGGPVLLQTDSAPAELPVDEVPGSSELSSARSFTGTFSCSSTARPFWGTLERGSDGWVTGTVGFDEADGASVGSFAVEGVEAGGGLTLQPLPWTELADGATPYLNFWVHGRFQDADFVGKAYQNIGDVCMDDGVVVTFE